MRFSFVLFLALLSLSSAAENSTKAFDDSHYSTGNPELATKIDCATMTGNCENCLKLPHCLFETQYNSCIYRSHQDHIPNGQFVNSSTDCPPTPSVLQINSNRIVKASNNETTTTTTESTTTTSVPTTTTSDGNTTTTPTGNTTATTTPPTTTSTASTTTSSSTSTTPTTPTTTANSTTTSPTTPRPTTAAPTPDPRGNKFDGWSFFGGILLTLGLAAIGYVSFRYYKARTGPAGTTYNRF